MQKIILRKALNLRPEDAQSMGSRLEPDRAMGRGGEAMPKSRLNEVCREQLPHPFERVDRFLHRLRGTTVHEIGIDENVCVFEGRCHERSLTNGNPFLGFV